MSTLTEISDYSSSNKDGNMAFINMATAEPQPGKEHELRERMKSFAKALGAQPGLVNVFDLREEGTKSLVGISIWRDKKSFEAGMAKLGNSPSKSSVSLVPPIVRQFQEVD